MALAGSIEQGNETSEHGRRGRGTRNANKTTVNVHSVPGCLRTHVGEATALLVKEVAVRVADLVEVLLDDAFLVHGALVVHGEATGREINGLFGARLVRASDRGNPWAGAREGGLKVSVVGAVVANAGVAGTGIARGENDGYTARAELADHGAHLEGVLAGHGLLFFTVRGGEGGGELRVLQGQKILEEIEVGLVGDLGARLVGRGDERAAAANGVLADRDGVGDGEDILKVKVGLDCGGN